MSKSAFASLIIDKINAAIGRDGTTYTVDSAYSAMVAVAEGITEYITNNTEVVVQYTGMVQAATPYPDPVVSDTFTITGNCAPTGPSNDFDEWIKIIESNIIAGFQLASPGSAGVVFSQIPFANIGVPTVKAQLAAIHDVLDEEPQQKVWEVICGDIMNWINTVAMNVVPGSASRPSAPSMGTAVIAKITIT